jgi:hypothetical protein
LLASCKGCSTALESERHLLVVGRAAEPGRSTPAVFVSPPCPTPGLWSVMRCSAFSFARFPPRRHFLAKAAQSVVCFYVPLACLLCACCVLWNCTLVGIEDRSRKPQGRPTLRKFFIARIASSATSQLQPSSAVRIRACSHAAIQCCSHAALNV